MESVVLRPGKLDVEYDKESDVLYISTGNPGKQMIVSSRKRVL